MTVTISHTAEEGTLVTGATRPVKDVIKAHRFRWSRNVGDDGAWYVPNSRDRRPDRPLIEALAAALRAAGTDVEVTIDDDLPTPAERELHRAERAEGRQAALEAKADRLAGQADVASARSHALVEMIPFGQPILVGHHSERRHRNALDKSWAAMGRSVGLSREADEAQRRAEASRANQAHRASGPATIRRIGRAETELRQIDRYLVEAEEKGHLAWQAKLLTRRADLEADVAYDREHLAALEAAGLKVYGPADFSVGDRVNGRATVVRVNRKTLTVRHDVWGPNGHTNPLPYDEVRSVERVGQLV